MGSKIGFHKPNPNGSYIFSSKTKESEEKDSQRDSCKPLPNSPNGSRGEYILDEWKCQYEVEEDLNLSTNAFAMDNI